jgi:hypothetical protein
VVAPGRVHAMPEASDARRLHRRRLVLRDFADVMLHRYADGFVIFVNKMCN